MEVCEAMMIQAENLTKVYKIPDKDPGVAGAVKHLFRPRHKSKTAVSDISFAIEPGEIVGYIGVNGAGKSTTIKMLTGILVPTAGQVRVLGRDPHSERVANARDVGVVFGQRSQLWWDLALIESLTMVGRIYEVPDARFQQLINEFSETLELKELLRVPIRNMSLGQKMRAELAATLIHEPRVVYLDEPTIGLDLLVKERIRDFIRRVNEERGTTVVLTTHDLGDIEELCKRVLIIDNGVLIYDGPLETIKQRFGKYREITFEVAADLPETALPAGAQLIEQADRRVLVRFDRTQTSASRVSSAVMNQVEVLDFSIKEPDLSLVVKQIYLGGLSSTNDGETTVETDAPGVPAELAVS
jgi:ABC-2 type transport system ATP-binding protein